MRTVIISLLTTVALIALPAMAEKKVEVTPDIENCDLSVANGTSQCADSACAGQKICTCSEPGAKIKWRSTNSVKIRIEFHSDSPFNGNCGDRAKESFTCTVNNNAPDGNYDYDIFIVDSANSCPDPVDPRVVIKGMTN